MTPTPHQPATDHHAKCAHRNSGKRNLFDTLVQLALDKGASDAVVIPTKTIIVDDRLAGLCNHPGCPNYGLAASCPPYVGGPVRFRKWLNQYEWGIVIRLDLPTDVLFGDDRREAFRWLHEIAARVECTAAANGCPDARGFAGGSCKALFCTDQPVCRVIDEGGTCRYPDRARPSMSGYGIDVSRLMAATDWNLDRVAGDTEPGASPTGPITALVLVC